MSGTLSNSTVASVSEAVARENLTTLQTFILSEEARFPAASGTFSWVLSSLALAAKVITSKIKRAGLLNVLGALEEENVQGELQQKLDVIANETLLRCLGSRSGVAIVASEENEQPRIIASSTEGERPYCVLFDPLDGSSNLDSCGSVGTIFSILRHDRRVQPAEAALLQPGVKQVGAGYVLYGSSVVFMLTTGHGVAQFVLDPSVGAFLLVNPNVRIPKSARIYSVNEAYRARFPRGYKNYLDWAHEAGYSTRYVGTMVADVHRILIKGGVFMYPPTAAHPKGKLRLMYEANPMAMLVEQAGGKAYACGLASPDALDGDGAPVTGPPKRLMEVEPTDIHQRTSVIMGSPDEVDNVLKHLQTAE